MSNSPVQDSELALPDGENGVHGKYRLLAELGKGGTANVYLAVAYGPSGFSKLVVLKVLKAELAVEAEFPRMFLNEARLAARLNHPNVVQTYEVLEGPGSPVIVMEYLEGVPLSRIPYRSREQGRPIPLAMHLRIISESLSGLHHSHELRDYDGTPLGVVHRDMTPQNIFVSFSGKISLLDFGIAKLTSSIADTQVGVLKGKLRYMPPEQVLGEKIDRRTDIFAVGVMIWEAITGQKIWGGASDSVVMHNILHAEIPSPRSVRPDVPHALERICMKALARNPDDRYATAADLQNDLEQWLSDHSLTNRTIGHFVESMFRDEHARTRETIERQLASAQTLAATTKAIGEGTVAVPRLRSTTASGSAPARSARRKKSGWAGRLLVPVFVLAGVWLGRIIWKRPPDTQPAPAPAPVALEQPPGPVAVPAEMTPAPQPPIEAKSVTLKVSALPAKAKLYLDEQLLPANPYSGTVPKDTATHVIRAEAPGFAPQYRAITWDEDRDVAVRLVPIRPGFQSHAAQPLEPLPSGPVAAPAPPEPKEDCNPPYQIDANGIRRLKPKCLSSLGE